MSRKAITVEKLISDLKGVIKFAPHVQHLADLEIDSFTLISATSLSREERKRFYRLRVDYLNDKLEKGRGGRTRKLKSKRNCKKLSLDKSCMRTKHGHLGQTAPKEVKCHTRLHIEARVLLQTSDFEPTSTKEDDSKKVFEIALKYATEDMQKNKEMLKRYIRVPKALLSQEAARQDKNA